MILLNVSAFATADPSNLLNVSASATSDPSNLLNVPAFAAAGLLGGDVSAGPCSGSDGHRLQGTREARGAEKRRI